MITIVSLCWNQYEMTENFLVRLKKYTDIPHKLVFTDNASIRPVEALVRSYYPEATVISNKENKGCPATRNESMERVDTDIVFWLDNDTLVGPKWYENILKTLEDPSVGISGPQGYIVKNPWTLPYPFQPVSSGDCDYFMGWLVGFKRKYYKLINDYHIPVNLDDVELAFGVKEKGARAVVCDTPFARHLVSQTKRGWEFNDQEKLKELWSNWPNKAIFEQYK